MAFDAASPPAVTPGAPEPALGPYLRALRRHWRLIAAITVLTAAVAAVTALRSGQTYSSTATVLVSPLDQGDANFVDTGVVLETGEPVRTVQTAAALINSLPAARTTAQKLGGGWNTGRVQAAVSVTPLGQSDVLNVTAQAESPAQAVKLANTFAQAAVAYRASIVQHNIEAQLRELNNHLELIGGSGVANLSLAQELATRIAALRAAQVGGGDPTLAVSGLARTASTTGAPRWLIVLLALIGGFAIGSVAALAVDFFNRRVRDIDEIKSLLPVPVLAAVPHLNDPERGGILRPGAFTPAAFEQVRMLRVQLASRKRAPVIMLTSAGAGDGKTTLAAALAAAFAETGEEVILMDLDMRKPEIARIFGLKQRRAVSLADGVLEELLVEVPDLPRVRVLPAPRGDIAQFATLLARLPTLLDEAESKARHVIIDAAPVGVVSESLEVAKVCDQVVVAVRPGHTDRQRLSLTADLLARANAPVVGAVVIGQSAATTDEVYTYGYGYGYGFETPGQEPASSGEVVTKGEALVHRRARAKSA